MIAAWWPAVSFVFRCVEGSQLLRQQLFRVMGNFVREREKGTVVPLGFCAFLEFSDK